MSNHVNSYARFTCTSNCCKKIKIPFTLISSIVLLVSMNIVTFSMHKHEMLIELSWLYHESSVFLLKLLESFWTYFEVPLAKLSARSETRGSWIFLQWLTRHTLAVIYSSLSSKCDPVSTFTPATHPSVPCNLNGKRKSLKYKVFFISLVT